MFSDAMFSLESFSSVAVGISLAIFWILLTYTIVEYWVCGAIRNCMLAWVLMGSLFLTTEYDLILLAIVMRLRLL